MYHLIYLSYPAKFWDPQPPHWPEIFVCSPQSAFSIHLVTCHPFIFTDIDSIQNVFCFLLKVFKWGLRLMEKGWETEKRQKFFWEKNKVKTFIENTFSNSTGTKKKKVMAFWNHAENPEKVTPFRWVLICKLYQY